jgi:hypothetical protein
MTNPTLGTELPVEPLCPLAPGFQVTPPGVAGTELFAGVLGNAGCEDGAFKSGGAGSNPELLLSGLTGLIAPLLDCAY